MPRQPLILWILTGALILGAFLGGVYLERDRARRRDRSASRPRPAPPQHRPSRDSILDRSTVDQPVATVWAYMEHNRDGDTLPKAGEAIKALMAAGVAHNTASTQVYAYRKWHKAGRTGPTPKGFGPRP